jgi:hypothetical protein
MAQLAPTAMAVFTQLSVSLKSPLIEMEEGTSAILPVLSTVMVCGLLDVSKT